jgi:hypothetical protein
LIDVFSSALDTEPEFVPADGMKADVWLFIMLEG